MINFSTIINLTTIRAILQELFYMYGKYSAFYRKKNGYLKPYLYLGASRNIVVPGQSANPGPWEEGEAPAVEGGGLVALLPTLNKEVVFW